MGNMTVKSVGVICCLSCSNACMCACIMLYRLFWKFATKTLGMDNIYPHCACTGLSHLLVCVNFYSAFFPELHTLISSVSLLIGITVPHRSEWVSHWGGGGGSIRGLVSYFVMSITIPDTHYIRDYGPAFIRFHEMCLFTFSSKSGSDLLLVDLLPFVDKTCSHISTLHSMPFELSRHRCCYQQHRQTHIYLVNNQRIPNLPICLETEQKIGNWN